MSRVYEVMFIVRPDIPEEEADKLVAGFSSTVTNGGGQVKSVEKMGRRRLAYMVRKFNDGNYVLMTIAANGAVVPPRFLTDILNPRLQQEAARRRGAAQAGRGLGVVIVDFVDGATTAVQQLVSCNRFGR